MATYAELYTLGEDLTHRERIAVAVAISASSIMNELPTVDNHAERLKWAAAALNNPGQEAERFVPVVLAENSTATVAQIESATDADILSNVESAIDLFAVADYGV